MNSRGWRMYLDYGDELFEPLSALLQKRSPARGVLAALALLRLIQAGEMDVPPPRELVAALCRVRLPAAGLAGLPTNVFRAAWKECARRAYVGDDVVAWIDGEVIPLFDWWVSEGYDGGEASARLPCAWSSHVRHWEQWQDEPATADGTRRWAALLPRLFHGAFVIRELCDERNLYAESVAMSHCVDGYVGECLRAEVHVFSITDKRSGDRVATLSLVPADAGMWDLGDLKGRHNCDVTAVRGMDDVVMALLRCVDDVSQRMAA